MKRLYFLPPFILQSLIWIPTRVTFGLFVHFKIEGLENLSGTNGPLIFSANHSSEWDVILIPSALPMFSRFTPMFYTAAEDKAFKNSATFGWRSYIYGGKFFKAWGAYPVYSGNKDYAFALRNHIKILQDNGSLCIFPEGYLSRDGSMGKAHGGVGFLSHRTQAPIVPVTISGVYNSSMKSFLMRKLYFKIHFGKPIPFPTAWEGELPPEEYKKYGQQILSIVKVQGKL